MIYVWKYFQNEKLIHRTFLQGDDVLVFDESGKHTATFHGLRQQVCQIKTMKKVTIVRASYPVFPNSWYHSWYHWPMLWLTPLFISFSFTIFLSSHGCALKAEKELNTCFTCISDFIAPEVNRISWLPLKKYKQF